MARQPGAKAHSVSAQERSGRGFAQTEGVSGLKALGSVRDLTYKLAFLAGHVKSADSADESMSDRELTEEEVAAQFTAEQREEILRTDMRLHSMVAMSLYSLSLCGRHIANYATLFLWAPSDILSRVVYSRLYASSRHVGDAGSLPAHGAVAHARRARPRGGEARGPIDAVRRRAQAHARGHVAEGRHQRVHRGRPVHGQEPVPQVRRRLLSPRHIHVRCASFRLTHIHAHTYIHTRTRTCTQSYAFC